LDLEAAAAVSAASGPGSRDEVVVGTHSHLLPWDMGGGVGGGREGLVEGLRVFFSGEADSRGLIAAQEAARWVG